MERSTHLLTPASLKALAHPLRVQLLSLLRTEGPSTATALAARVGESSGSTSYHLRQLAAADLVAEDPERGNDRDRWWKAAQASTRLESAALDEDPATQAAADTYLSLIAQGHHTRLQHWISTARSWRGAWRDSGTMDDWQLSLSAKELEQLSEEVEALVETYRREPRKGDQRVAVHYVAFPLRAKP